MSSALDEEVVAGIEVGFRLEACNAHSALEWRQRKVSPRCTRSMVSRGEPRAIGNAFDSERRSTLTAVRGSRSDAVCLVRQPSLAGSNSTNARARRGYQRVKLSGMSTCQDATGISTKIP